MPCHSCRSARSAALQGVTGGVEASSDFLKRFFPDVCVDLRLMLEHACNRAGAYSSLRSIAAARFAGIPSVLAVQPASCRHCHANPCS